MVCPTFWSAFTALLPVFILVVACIIILFRMGEPRPSMPKRGSETRLCDECGMGRSCRCP